jgi:predicted DNA-binding protein (MmcQ/YjbR family)
MHQVFTDTFCAGLPDAVQHEPFGPDMVVWRVAGHMFATYTPDGEGLSLRAANSTAALLLIQQGHAISAPYVKGWLLFAWATRPDDLRAHITRSYDVVLTENPTPQD